MLEIPMAYFISNLFDCINNSHNTSTMTTNYVKWTLATVVAMCRTHTVIQLVCRLCIKDIWDKLICSLKLNHSNKNLRSHFEPHKIVFIVNERLFFSQKKISIVRTLYFKLMLDNKCIPVCVRNILVSSK